jgi:hypothetical protein
VRAVPSHRGDVTSTGAREVNAETSSDTTSFDLRATAGAVLHRARGWTLCDVGKVDALMDVFGVFVLLWILLGGLGLLDPTLAMVLRAMVFIPMIVMTGFAILTGVDEVRYQIRGKP